MKPIAFYPELAIKLGDIPSAIYYQQLYYWSDKGKRDDGFIWKTKEEIEEETTIKRKVQDRIRKNLEKNGWIETKVMKVGGIPTVHYRCLVHFKLEFGKGGIDLLEKVESGLSIEKAESGFSSIQRIPENTHIANEKKFTYKNGKKIDITTGDNYTSDKKSPLDTLQARRKLARLLGKSRSTKWTQMLFGSAWDFLRAFEHYQKYKYKSDVFPKETARVLASWFEQGEDRESVKKIIEAFFNSDKADKFTITPNLLFSQHTYDSWKQGKLIKKHNQNKKQGVW